MAWGMFCWIPCPYKRWDDGARLAQLAMFPLVGTMIGLVVGATWWLLCGVLSVDALLAGVLLTALYFLLTGFIHLDGFMDCCDAVMPRHPDMRERRRILKDPHTGAFAAVSLVLMLMIFAACFVTAADGWDIGRTCVFACILTSSRTVSAVSVMLCEPMATSQYGASRGKVRDTIPALIIFAAVLAAAELIVGGPAPMTFVFEPRTNIPVLAVILVGAAAGHGARKALGGMSGDIAGFLVVLAELAGMVAMAVM